MRRLDCHDAIKQVRRSYQTALRTVKLLIGIVENQPMYLYNNDLNLAELRSLLTELHDIYYIRMFATFETKLRDYWASIKNTKPKTHQLISSIAKKRGMDQDTLDTVQEIRDFRNYLVHEEFEVKRKFTLEEASGYLNTYLARLPLEW